MSSMSLSPVSSKLETQYYLAFMHIWSTGFLNAELFPFTKMEFGRIAFFPKFYNTKCKYYEFFVEDFL